MRALLGLAALVALLLGGLAVAQNSGQPDQKKQDKPHAFRLDVEQIFKEYDNNNNGFLERDELPPYLRDHFDKLDLNKDGKLSREELEKGAHYLQPHRRPSDVVFVLIEMSDFDDECPAELQRMYDVLRKLDKNNSGKIDSAALKIVRQQLLEERVDNIIKELDANKDGKISREEARGMIKKNFDKIDTNKDGFIDREELLRAASERIITKKENKEK